MPKRPLRSFLAILVVVGSAVPGLAGAGASAATAAPTVPTGGCWRYVPGPAAEIDDTTGITDISTTLEPWAEDPQLTLGTSGDTAVGGVRSFTLVAEGGPSVEPQLTDTTGTAAYYFDVIDPEAQRTALDPVVVDFDLESGATAIPAMQADGTFGLEVAGTSALILRGVFFDLPELGQRLACNGQPVGTALVNPATTPLDTSVVAGVTSVAARSVAVDRVVGQNVLTAARPGDAVDVTLAGFASEVPVQLGFCGPGATACGTAATVETLADGSASATLVVPSGAAVGAGSIRARSGGDVVVDQPVQVLGAPALALAENSEADAVVVTGSQWDPRRQVRLKAVDDSGERIGAAVDVNAADDGQIEAGISVPADAEVAAIVASQQRPGAVLEASIDVPAHGGGGGGGDGGDDQSGSGASGGTGGDATNTPVASAPAASAPLPLDIPAPIDLPVNSVLDPPGAAAADVLAVSKVAVVGSTGLADLFGGGPDRVLRFQVENISKADVIAPGLSIAVGKGDDPDPIYTSDGFGRLEPGESLNVEIPISLSAGAFGVYSIAGQIGSGESGAFAITWETYPWGLFALNALGVLLVLFAVRRRFFAPAPSRVSALTAAPGAAVVPSGSATDAGAAVIDLAVLERWWALQSDDATARGPAGADVMADAVVDVDAVERWLERCSARTAEAQHSVPRASSEN